MNGDETTNADQGFLLSPQQRRVWLRLARLEAGRGAIVAAGIASGVSAAELQRRFHALAGRHEMLRTRFHRLAGMTFPLQVIGAHPAGSFEMRRDADGADAAAVLAGLVEEASGRTFDPEAGTLHWTCAVPVGGRVAVVTGQSPLVNDAAGAAAFLAALTGPDEDGILSGEPDLQYVDLAQWYDDLANGDEGEEGRRFWADLALRDHAKASLPGLSPDLFLDATPVRMRLPWTGPAAVPDGLRCGLPALALAAWAATLARFSGSARQAVACRVDGRADAQVRRVLGRCERHVPIVVDAGGDRPFSDLAETVEETLRAASGWQECFLWDKATGGSAKAIGERTLPFAFAWRQEADHPALDRHEVRDDAEPYQLRLELTLHGSRPPVLELAAAQPLQASAVVSALADALCATIEAVLARPSLPCAALPLVPVQCVGRILAASAGETVAFDGAATLDGLVLDRAARVPDAVAVEDGSVRASYGMLASGIHAVAGRLAAVGVAGRVVALLLPRSADYLCAALGASRSGAMFLPLDPALPDGRLRDMLADADPAAIVASPATAGRAGTLARCPLVLVDGAGAVPEGPASPATGGGEAPAYLMYTSGSTGRPKGVVVPHRAVRNFLLWSQSRFPLSVGDRVLFRASVGFDASIWEAFAPLVAGATVVVAPPEAGQDPSVVAAMLREAGITVLKTTPTLTSALLQLGAFGPASALRLVFCGAERLPGPLARRFAEACPGALLVNMYGPTEACIDVSCHVPETGTAPDWIPIGRPIANVVLRVLDDAGRPVPPGIPGELFIGGANLALGYLNRPAEQSDRFRPDPFAADGSLLFRTGDVVRLGADGSLEFLGRVDDQVKIRGARVEPGEIEAALARHGSVARCAVVAREDTGSPRLIAYVSPADVPVEELRAFLAGNLPDYMVPSAFVALDALPLTPGGKIDRAALPAPATRHVPGDRAGPRTPAERVLAAIFAKVLQLPEVGIHDSFFDLGGDSILSVQVVSAAAQEGLTVTVRGLFDHKTVAGLAENLGTAAISADQGPVVGEAPLMPVQLRLLERGLPDLHHFNQAMMFNVAEGLDPGIAAEVLAHLLHHHDALRVRLRHGAAGWLQEIAPPGAPAALDVVDLSGVRDPEALSRAIEADAEGRQRSLDLENGPIFRGVLYRTPPGRPERLLLLAHHMGVDGVSWRILLEDFANLYSALAEGREPRLPPKTTSFPEWSRRIQALARSGVLEPELGYWLDDARKAVPPLPVDFPDGIGRNTMGETRDVLTHLTPEATRDLLQRTPAAFGTQINDVLLCAFVRSFHAWTGHPAIVADMDAHGREELFDDVSLARTVGWFTSVYPVLVRMRPGDDALATLSHVREQMQRVPDRGISYGILRYAGARPDVEARLRALPPAQTSFNYLGQLDQAIDRPPLLGWAEESPGLTQSPAGRLQHLLEMNCYVVGGRFTCQWTYGRHLFRPETIERLAARYLAEITGLIDAARARAEPEAVR